MKHIKKFESVEWRYIKSNNNVDSIIEDILVDIEDNYGDVLDVLITAYNDTNGNRCLTFFYKHTYLTSLDLTPLWDDDNVFMVSDMDPNGDNYLPKLTDDLVNYVKELLKGYNKSFKIEFLYDYNNITYTEDRPLFEIKIGERPTNENVVMSKKYISNMPIKNFTPDEFKTSEDLRKAAKPSEEFDEERNKISNKYGQFLNAYEQSNKDIFEMCKDHPGWTYPFIYWANNELISYNKLRNVYNRLIKMKDVLNQLPKPIHEYVPPIPNTREGFNTRTKTLEKLEDDLNKIEKDRQAKSIYNQFPSKLKREFDSLPNKEKYNGLFLSFYELEDKDTFMNKVSAFKSIGELLQKMEDYVESTSEFSYTKILEQAKEIKDVDIVYNNKEDKIIIVELKSFTACNSLMKMANWCIQRDNYYWDNYVGAANMFTRQYAIFNFRVPISDKRSVIGVTVKEDGGFYTAHLKDDSFIKSQDMEEFLSMEEMDYLKPMSEEDIEKKKYLNSVRNRVARNSTIPSEEVYQSIEYGLDPDYLAGSLACIAVINDDLELLKYLKKKGASIKGSVFAGKVIIDYFKSLNVMKFLLECGCDMTTTAFRNLIKIDGGIQYAIDNGMDVNFSNGFAIRWAVNNLNFNIFKLLVDSGDVNPDIIEDITDDCIENEAYDILDYIVNKTGYELTELDKRILLGNIMIKYQSVADVEDSFYPDNVKNTKEKLNWLDTNKELVLSRTKNNPKIVKAYELIEKI